MNKILVEENCVKCGQRHEWIDDGTGGVVCILTNHWLILNHAGGMIDCKSPHQIEMEHADREFRRRK